MSRALPTVPARVSEWCLPTPALPAAGMMPVEEVTGSQGATWALGQVLHGDIWAKPCSWSYPWGFFTSLRRSLVIALWTRSALQESGLPEGSLGRDPAPRIHSAVAADCMGASDVLARITVLLHLPFLLPYPLSPLISRRSIGSNTDTHTHTNVYNH